eukprot:scaffold3032_cov375-Prasinococcus_capsulatus_cf.AAC.18
MSGTSQCFKWTLTREGQWSAPCADDFGERWKEGRSLSTCSRVPSTASTPTVTELTGGPPCSQARWRFWAAAWRTRWPHPRVRGPWSSRQRSRTTPPSSSLLG